MTGYLGKRTNQERDIVGQQVQNQQENQWGPIPGEIVSYDAAAGTATVKPLYKPIHNGQPVDMPDLYEVPVDLQRTANAGVTFPIPSGTKVMLTPAMRSMDNYEAGEGGQPYDRRSFSLSDMRATIAGGDSLSDPLANVDPDNTHLRFNAEGTFGIKGSPDGKFKIEGAEGNLYDIIATFMELVAADQLQINYGSSGGSGHQLQNRAALMVLAAKVRAMAL
ncbi:Gp138 family membrane-puncturing spike protein [Pararhizobium sp.]|uniref:Gp138 family membrane-puncturing spike protein n=1 Tax=Pararhizobium sp. TaxID=1977563 RepID=UPI002726C323|nr:Gp138 family membrane-puncturing spike protein [Pararhizobium sp.]MDO9417042.1 Gp138 family membrane-puncturing spike protein [Pararhizobium sp.]